jgi:(1->4)-alpha-D-glucan 1-alpha-D-glucosylmutase
VENPAWWDVLQHGRESEYAAWFDIDWTRDRVVVPILGDDAELSIVDGELRYFEHRFPLGPGTWEPGDEPDEVHARQNYELVHFRRGNTELNYRRFFAVTTLAGVRVEEPAVFDATHARVAAWVEDRISGLRIDHPDGLVDPAGYLKRLREIAPEAWITVEKILEPGEVLPADWPVAGTTGYDAMREVNGLFIDGSSETEFTDLYRRLTGDDWSLSDHIEAGKRMVTAELLQAEVRRMAALAPDVPDAAQALAETAVAFEVYRSYLPAGVENLAAALDLASRRRPELTDTLVALRPRLQDPADELALRMQQLSGATMAKGVEDTAYYRYSRFVALNEVGGNPDEFGIDPASFHAAQERRHREQPSSMTALSTHDTKRGEDVRARLAVLSEIPPEWTTFAELVLSVSTVPNRAFAYFVAQSLAGAGTIDRSRLHAYVEKAMREAADGTGWVDQDAEFESSVHALVEAAYDDPTLRAAWESLLHRIETAARSNSLGQKLVQITMPGVPDVYQGTEIWEDSLVDPDNRRPVDFANLRGLLNPTSSSADLSPALDDSGAAKIRVTSAALRLRRDQPHLFTTYVPLSATGIAADHLVAFDRGGAVVLATRLPIRLADAGGWRDTTLELRAQHSDLLTGRMFEGPVPVAEILTDYPVALLVR